MDADDATLRNAIDGKEKQIRRAAINAQPSLLPLEFVPEDIRGGRLSLETYHARAQAVREHTDFKQRVSCLLAARYADQKPHLHVEESIYAGFPTPADEARMNYFHKHAWPERQNIIETIEDGRFRELGKRVVASECPELLSDQQRKDWQAWRRDRLMAGGDVPWTTIAAAHAQIAELKEESLPEHQQRLSELECFVASMAT